MQEVSLTFGLISTWTAYRKTEPLRWTSYADDCVRVLSEGQETKLDALLALQAKCHVITNQVTCPPTDDSIDSDSSSGPSSALFTAMLNQLSDIRKGLSDQIREDSKSLDLSFLLSLGRANLTLERNYSILFT